MRGTDVRKRVLKHERRFIHHRDFPPRGHGKTVPSVWAQEQGRFGIAAMRATTRPCSVAPAPKFSFRKFRPSLKERAGRPTPQSALSKMPAFPKFARCLLEVPARDR